MTWNKRSKIKKLITKDLRIEDLIRNRSPRTED